MLASFSVAPLGVTGGVGERVAGVIDLIDRSGLDYRVGAMQTTVEGELEEVMALIVACHKHMLTQAPRVFTHIALDDRAGATGRLEGKVRSVEAALGRTVRHE